MSRRAALGQTISADNQNIQTNDDHHNKPKVIEVYNMTMTKNIPRIKCYENNNMVYLNVYQKHKMLFRIDMSNPLLDAYNTYDTNTTGRSKFNLKQILSRICICK